MSCPLCSPSKNVILRSTLWTVVLNDDQAFIGRCYFSLNRHETDVTKLSGPELSELWSLFSAVKDALEVIWHPDHYNYVFLMNVQPHLHGHIIPRYAEDREFDGIVFKDGRIGSHYDLDNTLTLKDDILSAIAEKIRSTIDMATKEKL